MPEMKIDLHVHTKERSACGKSSEEEQIRAAIAAGLDAIVITDHHRLMPLERLIQLNQIYAPFRLFSGIEVTIVENEDILVFGVQDPALELTSWRYVDLYSFVHERHGLLVLAHPFRYHPEIKIPLVEYPPDAIEVYSNNTPLTFESTIRKLATDLHIPVLSNSDAHITTKLGGYYNLLDIDPRSEVELLTQLKTGLFTLFAGNPKGFHNL